MGITSREQIDIQFNDQTNQFVVTPTSQANASGVVAAGERLMANSVRTSVGELNRAIKIIEPILQADGLEVAPELDGLFQAMGIDDSAGKEPTFIRRLQGAVKAVVGQMGENVGGKKGSVVDAAKEGWKNPPSLPQYLDDEESTSLGLPDDRTDDEGFDLLSLTDPVAMSAEPGTFSPVLEVIGGAEAPQGYNQIYGHDRFAPLEDMTLDEVLGLQSRMRKNGSKSSAVGRYQFLRKTLAGLKGRLNLTGDEEFTPELQDRLAVALLERRGLNAYLDGKLSRDQFADRLAMEWAGLPTSSGRSHYHGDGLNRSTVKRESLLSALDTIMPAG